MSNDRIQPLLEKFITGTLSEPERNEFVALLHAPENQPVLEELVDGHFMQSADKNTADAETLALIYQQVMLAKEFLPQQAIVRKMPGWRRWAVAASLLVIVGVGYWLLTDKPIPAKGQAVASEKERFKNDIIPGREKAVLVLADGRQVELEGAGTQKLTDTNGAIINNSNGTISYSKTAVPVVYNTLKVPRKGEYSLLLADGSTVKLNAESSIRYPTAFNGNERRVEITGEAYFEVAKDASKPFIVQVKGMEVKVLGTHFLVNAYDNEAVIKTTLTEGSVQVKSEAGSQKSEVTIKPGEQARVGADGTVSVTSDIKLDEELAWTKGYFNFSHAGIETIMRQVERWYDVEVQYEASIDQLFVAEIPRSVSVIDFFRILEATGWVHFSIDGNKVMVTK